MAAQQWENVLLEEMMLRKQVRSLEGTLGLVTQNSVSYVDGALTTGHKPTHSVPV